MIKDDEINDEETIKAFELILMNKSTELSNELTSLLFNQIALKDKIKKELTDDDNDYKNVILKFYLKHLSKFILFSIIQLLKKEEIVKKENAIGLILSYPQTILMSIIAEIFKFAENLLDESGKNTFCDVWSKGMDDINGISNDFMQVLKNSNNKEDNNE